MRALARSGVRLAALAAAAAAFAACGVTVGSADYSVREEKRFAVTGPAQVSLSTFDGSIQIRGWDRSDVLVEVEKHGPSQAVVDRIEIKSSQSGNVITIDVLKPSPLESSGFHRSPGASLVVSLPRQSAVTARSGDGSFEVRRVAGKVDLETGDGSVQVDDVQGDLEVRTGDGSVSGRGIDGTVRVRTGDGSVSLDGVLTGVRLETRDGTIEVTARRGSRADGEWDVTTGDGDIRLEIPESFAADIDARTGDGRIHARNVGADIGGDDRPDQDSSAARFPIGGGGKSVRLRTSSGSITIAAGPGA